MPALSPVFIALGSNIDPEANLKAAAGLLRARWPMIRFSPVYRSKAVGYEAQDDFLNAAAQFETDQSAESVHEALVSIEGTLKKATPFRNGPRTIDLDLLLYGNQQLTISNPELRVPHPRMHERRFVLQPLFDLTGNDDWKRLLENVKDKEIILTKIDLNH